MQTLVASTSRAHAAVDVRFADKAPTSNSPNVVAVQHLRVDDRVGFWFRNAHSCRLCPDSHMTSSPTSHFNTGQEARNHTTREIFLSYFMEEIKLGVYTGSSRWITRLAKKRDDSVINAEIVRRVVESYREISSDPESKSSELTSSSSSSSSLPPEITAKALYENSPDPVSCLTEKELKFEANLLVMQSSFLSSKDAESIVRMPPLIRHRCHFLRHVLGFLRSVNILGPSLVPARASQRELDAHPTGGPLRTTNANNTARFEFNEYIGDSMNTRGSAGRVITVMPHRDWLSPAQGWALGILRDGVESNFVLMLLAEMIGMNSLLDKDVILGGGKPLADVLESVSGELYFALAARTSTAGQRPNLPLLHPLTGAVLPPDDRVLDAIIKWTLEELSDLAALVFVFHFGSSARLEPFLRELLYQHARMTPLAAIKTDRSPRPVPVSRRFARLMSSSSSCSSTANSSSSSAAAAAAAAVGLHSNDGPLAPSADFTFVRTTVQTDEHAGSGKTEDSASSDGTIVSLSQGARLRKRRKELTAKESGTFSNPVNLREGAIKNLVSSILPGDSSRDELEVRRLCDLPLLPEKKSRATTTTGGGESADSAAALNPDDVFRFDTVLSSVRPVSIDESRVFDDTKRFEINTGNVPEVVRLAEARRREDMEKRRSQRKKRQI